MNKINSECPICHLINIIFDSDNLPKKCQFCGANLIENYYKIERKEEEKWMKKK